MIREACYFLRHARGVLKRHKAMGLVEFRKDLARRMDAEGYAELRLSLVGDLEGRILEIGTGTGVTLQYYGPNAKVTAMEPHDEFRAAAVEAALNATAEIEVISGKGESLPFEDATFDAVSASQVLCSVTSPGEVLEELKRVLRPGGQIRLLEHVRSENRLAGFVMDILNPIWLSMNKVGCHWNRRIVEEVKAAGFVIRSVERYKIFSEAAPLAFPFRVVKAERLD